jgi:hypothetical protein
MVATPISSVNKYMSDIMECQSLVQYIKSKAFVEESFEINIWGGAQAPKNIMHYLRKAL